MKHAPEHLDWRKVITAGDDTPPDIIKALDDYFSPFAQPVNDDKWSTEKPLVCINCGEALTGFLASMIGRGGFTWGLAHGEGFCAGCKWPARAHHYIKDASGADIASIRNLVLQYHPDFVSEKAGAA